MNKITKQFNFVDGFKKLKVKTIVGNYAIVVDQKDNFIGVADATLVENKNEIMGKPSSTKVQIKCVAHASYKHNMIVREVTQQDNCWWGVGEDGKAVIIEHCSAPKIKHLCIAASLLGYKEIPLINILN